MTLPTFPDFLQRGVGYVVPKNALQCDPLAVETLNRHSVTMDEIIRVKKWLLFCEHHEYVFYQIWAMPPGVSAAFNMRWIP